MREHISSTMLLERDGAYGDPFHYEHSFYQAPNAMFHEVLSTTSCTLERKPHYIAKDGFDFINLDMRLSGTGACSYGSEESTVRPGEMRIADFTRHSRFVLPEHHSICVALNRQALSERVLMLDRFHGWKLPDGPMSRVLGSALLAVFDQLPGATQHDASIMTDFLISLIADAMNYQTINCMESVEISDISVFSAILNTIRRNLHDPDCSAVTIASDLGVSKSKLYRLCEDLGTPAELLRNERLRKAAKMLGGSAGTNLDRLAFNVGFASRQSFSRAFKAQFGLSPRDYRNGPVINSDPLPQTNPFDMGWVKMQTGMVQSLTS
ncbi:AraC family transcriptional regulator [Nitratireductor sp. XY-223]|uniref:AraC family transcriptional regulator n=1 Tax=Nitratireductor sp. XY-223 TaxID=2561926 RepID=UPI00145AF745|nr:AraC family transcriptional regulator [Nitratireductor sp. XY-223]